MGAVLGFFERYFAGEYDAAGLQGRIGPRATVIEGAVPAAVREEIEGALVDLETIRFTQPASAHRLAVREVLDRIEAAIAASEPGRA